MTFRLKALALHLVVSCVVLSLTLGTLYLCWYRWPGWYLADAGQVTGVLAAVDLVLGPLLTFVVASDAKPRRVLARDISVIGVLQLSALIYGSLSLWNGRPLYYAFSEDVIQVVQAYDFEPQELALANRQNAPLRPHWYSLPRWVWAPLPADPKEHDRIVQSAVSGGSDVIAMPRYYQAWEAGLPTLRTRLTKIDDLKYFNGIERKSLKASMQRSQLPTDLANCLAVLGRGRPVLAVFDPATLTIKRFLKPE